MDNALPTRLHLELSTPDRQVVRDSVLEVSLPGKDGYLGILPGHAPLLSELRPGELSYAQDGVKHYLAVSWGFAEVLPDRVIVLVEESEKPEEINVEQARQDRKGAERRLSSAGEPSADLAQAQSDLELAMARLEVAAHRQESLKSSKAPSQAESR